MQIFERRRDRFDFFDRMESPAVNLCFTLEVPDFRPWCREEGLAPFHVFLCAVLRAVLEIEHFRYRIMDGEVTRIDRLVPSFTVMNGNITSRWSFRARYFRLMSDDVSGDISA